MAEFAVSNAEALFHMAGICATIVVDVPDYELDEMLDAVRNAEADLPDAMRRIVTRDNAVGDAFRSILPAILLAEQRRRHGSH